MRTAPGAARRWTAALAAALAVTSCLGLTGSSGPRDDLDANRRKWRAQGYDSYQYRFQKICFCGPDVTAPVLIVVRGGAIASVTLEQTGRPVDPSAFSRYLTVDQVFDVIEQAIDDDAEVVRVTYDATLGYPADVYIDPEGRLADDEGSLHLDSLVAIR